jgi:hypothetical protein
MFFSKSQLQSQQLNNQSITRKQTLFYLTSSKSIQVKQQSHPQIPRINQPNNKNQFLKSATQKAMSY